MRVLVAEDEVRLAALLEQALEGRGYRVARNAPYAGGTHLPDITVIAPDSSTLHERVDALRRLLPQDLG